MTTSYVRYIVCFSYILVILLYVLSWTVWYYLWNDFE